MIYLHNKPQAKQRRTQLRHDQTPYEALLWSKLRNRKLYGHKFYRQYGLGPYILDFYCPAKNLAIELDGSQHLNEDNEKYDEIRSQFLNRYGIKVIRFWNPILKDDLDSVINKIIQALWS